jgi:hypothetical protein
MIINLGLREKLIDIFVNADTKILSIGSLRVIGEMSFQFDSEAVNFINLNIMQVI